MGMGWPESLSVMLMSKPALKNQNQAKKTINPAGKIIITAE
jgi:hypothetical protein